MNIKLALKAVYYDLIAKGLKTYEYRDITDYYIRRLTKDNKYTPGEEPNYAPIDSVTFFCGKDPKRPAMTYEVKKIKLWPEGKNPTHFVLCLGKKKS